MRSASRSGSRRNTVAAKNESHPMSDSETILQEADRVTSADRQRYYGHPLDNHRCTAEMWQSFLIRRGWTPPADGMNVRDVCWLNILQKASRDANQAKRDNLVDTCGYARNAEQAQEESLKRLGEQGIAKVVPTPEVNITLIPALPPLPGKPLEKLSTIPPLLPSLAVDHPPHRMAPHTSGYIQHQDFDEFDHGRPQG